MEQQQNQRPAPAGRPRLTREQWLARRRRKRLRLLRNWVLFLSACGMAVGLMTGLILWLLPRAGALLGGSQQFEAPSYDLSGYVCDPSDPYLVLVNNNLPLSAGPAPAAGRGAPPPPPPPQPGPAPPPARRAGAVAYHAPGKQLQPAAAGAYRAMADAAGQVGIRLTLEGGYQTAEQAKQDFDARKQGYLDGGMDDAQADARAASIVPRPGCNERVTGLAALILAEGYDTLDTGFANTDAFRWLSAYAADYGFILRWPEDRQAATGMVFQPWHWRYVGVENARAIAASGLSLEEFLAVNQLA